MNTAENRCGIVNLLELLIEACQSDRYQVLTDFGGWAMLGLSKKDARYSGYVRSDNFTLILEFIMSWNIEERYCCLEIDCIRSKTELDVVLQEYAQVIWQTLQHTGECPEHFYSVEEEIPSRLEEAVPMITAELWKYAECVEFKERSVSIVVHYEYDSERDDSDLFEELCKYLFSRTSSPFFQIHSAAFDNAGSYSHQWIGFRKDGKIFLENSGDYFERVFQMDQEAVLPVG